MKSILTILTLALVISCSSSKQSHAVQVSDSDKSYDTNVDLNLSVANYFQTVDLKKLCNPVKLFVMFSVDSTGKIYDTAFKPTILSDNNCVPDSIYMNSMKAQFERQISFSKQVIFNDSTRTARYYIPVTFE